MRDCTKNSGECSYPILWVYSQHKNQNSLTETVNNAARHCPKIQTLIIQQRLDSGLKLSGCVPLKRPTSPVDHINIVQVLQSPVYDDEGLCPSAQTVDDTKQTNY